jgi:hypothetical protein
VRHGSEAGRMAAEIAHDLPKAARSLSAKATAAQTTGAHPRGRASMRGTRMTAEGYSADEAKEDPKVKSRQAEPGRRRFILSERMAFASFIF